MKVTLLALGAKYIHLSPAPFYLAAELSDTPYTVEILDHSVNESKETVLADIISSAPDVIGFSAYIWNIVYLKELLPMVKNALPHVFIVLGGPEVSYCAQEILEKLSACDAVLSGEGEIPFRMCCDAVCQKTELSAVPGISYREKGSIVLGTPYIGKGTPKSPLDAGYAEALKGRIAYIESSRGCPFSCAFCLSGRCGGVRFFDMEQTKRDILLLSRESRTVKFVDRTFNAKCAHCREIILFILEHYKKEIPEGTCFHFELAGELLTDDIMSLLEKAPRGLFQAEIGVQSFHAPTLRAIRRSDKTERLSANIARLLQNGNVHVHIDLIAGLPEESLSAFENSFNLAYALSPHMLQLGFLKLLHGAPMREEKEKFPCRYRANPPYEIISTPVLTENDLGYIHTVEKGLDRVYNSGRYRRTLSLCSQKGSAHSPFRLFFELGIALNMLPTRYTLNDEIGALYSFFLQMGLPANELRDAMLLDFLSVNSSRFVPSALRRENPLYGRVKNETARLCPLSKGVRRAIMLFESRKEIALVDYTEKDPVTGEYPLQTLALSDLI